MVIEDNNPHHHPHTKQKCIFTVESTCVFSVSRRRAYCYNILQSRHSALSDKLISMIFPVINAYLIKKAYLTVKQLVYKCLQWVKNSKISVSWAPMRKAMSHRKPLFASNICHPKCHTSGFLQRTDWCYQ